MPEHVLTTPLAIKACAAVGANSCNLAALASAVWSDMPQFILTDHPEHQRPSSLRVASYPNLDDTFKKSWRRQCLMTSAMAQLKFDSQEIAPGSHSGTVPQLLGFGTPSGFLELLATIERSKNAQPILWRGADSLLDDAYIQQISVALSRQDHGHGVVLGEAAAALLLQRADAAAQTDAQIISIRAATLNSPEHANVALAELTAQLMADVAINSVGAMITDCDPSSAATTRLARAMLTLGPQADVVPIVYVAQSIGVVGEAFATTAACIATHSGFCGALKAPHLLILTQSLGWACAAMMRVPICHNLLLRHASHKEEKR